MDVPGYISSAELFRASRAADYSVARLAQMYRKRLLAVRCGYDVVTQGWQLRVCVVLRPDLMDLELDAGRPWLVGWSAYFWCCRSLGRHIVDWWTRYKSRPFGVYFHSDAREIAQRIEARAKQENVDVAEVKFSDMTVGDTVSFRRTPKVGAPLTGVVTALTNAEFTYEHAGVRVSLRRNSVIAHSRRRRDAKVHWEFE